MIFEQNDDIPECSQIYVLFDYQLRLQLLHTVSIDFRITFRYSKNENNHVYVQFTINDNLIVLIKYQLITRLTIF